MKRTLLLIGCTVSAALACLVLLVMVSGMPNDGKNGFDRQWLSVEIRQQHSQQLPLAAERLFGAGDQLYLSDPSHQQLYSVNGQLHVKDTILLNVNKQLRPPVRFSAIADHIYIHDFNSGKLYHKSILAEVFDSVKLTSGPYIKALQVSDSIVVIRAFKEGTFHPVFKRINIHDRSERVSDLLSETADAGLSTDGILCINTQSDRLFYVPYFKNGIYCLDNVLTLRYHQPTLDTVFDNGIEITQRGSGELQKLYASAARVRVNKRAFANDHLLFIESDLRADNEEKQAFGQHPVLDVYYTEDGRYAGSFHLPVEKKDVSAYHINGNMLYVLLKGRITSFVLEALP